MDKTLVTLIEEEEAEKRIMNDFEKVFSSLHDAFALEQPPQENEIKKDLEEFKTICNELIKIKKQQKKRMPTAFHPDIAACNLALLRIIKLIDSIEQQQAYNLEHAKEILQEIRTHKKTIEKLISKALTLAKNSAATA